MEHFLKKRLGQHFLTDRSIAGRIVGALDAGRSGPILEIGPGRGILTDLLVGLGRTVFAVEKDRGLARHLEERRGEAGILRIIPDDILGLDLRDLLAGEGASSVSVIGNIPFQITSPLVDYLIRHRDVIRDTVIMVQKEVADRIVAVPGGRDYGSITVVLNYFASVKFLFRVKRGSFYPAPEVDASVLKMVFDGFSGEYRAADEDLFVRIVRTMFGWRRKQVQKILRTHPDIDLTHEGIERLRGKLRFPLSGRPEDLTIRDFIDLANELPALRDR